MAEAHQAVAFSFNLAPGGGIHFYYDTVLLQDIWHSYVRSWRYKTVRFRNNLSNNVFPLKTWSYLLFLMFATVAMYNPVRPIRDPTFGFATGLRKKLVSAKGSHFYDIFVQTAFVYIFYLILWLVCVKLIRSFMHMLLCYRNVMYERRNMSLRTKLWLVTIKFITKITTPKLYSYQGILPNLPLPSLKDTLKRHLKTVRPLLSDEEYDKMVQVSAAFERNEGRKFQRYVWFKWLLSSNYVADWWERFVYLRSRTPLLVNSNFYAMDNLRVCLTNRQASRAANLIYCMMKFRDIIQREEWKPMMLGDIMPLCSWQHTRQFDTTRIPGVESDTLQHSQTSATHVAVLHRGRWFQLTTHYRGQQLLPCELEAHLEIIVNDPSPPVPGEARLAALTAGDRTHWATTRQQFFMRGGGVNSMSLNAIERAAFVIALDDAEHVYDPDDSSQLDAYGHWMLCGDGSNRWCDKTYTAVVLKNGRIGVNVEHSWSDAPVTGVMWEWVIVEDLAVCGYTEDGRCRGEARQLQPPPAPPLRLQFALNEACCENIDKALVVARSLLENTQLTILHFSDYGKAFMKTCKVSPDGFIQLVLQLAYYRDVGRLELTYEACMTRLYVKGRTETVRSVSTRSAAFVYAMESKTTLNDDADCRRRLLKEACDEHQTLYLDCMNGKGIDRHLFTLFVISKYLNIQSPFLDAVIMEPWRLSTSQTPHGLTGRIDVNNPLHMSAGGGFGPVSDDGYGVSYIISGENDLFFHVSSKRSCSSTDPDRFRERIRTALHDIRALYASMPAAAAAAAVEAAAADSKATKRSKNDGTTSKEETRGSANPVMNEGIKDSVAQIES